MRVRLAFLGAATAGFAAVARLLRRRQAEMPDRRADELRQRLDESRAVVSEREEFEAAETPIDEVEPVAEAEPVADVESAAEVDDRRREIHDRARSAAEEMRRGGD